MTTITHCQHLHDKDIQYCQVFIDGVFIPMPLHINHFCRTSNCNECFQFMKSQEHLTQSQQKNTLKLNETRRQHLRFSQQWQLFIAPNTAKTNSIEAAPNQAKTIDISTGGFRLSSQSKLEPSKKFSFIFADAHSAPFSSGIGKIIWTRPDTTTGGFQSGLALIRGTCP